MNSQINILDSSRAFAALSVCLYHFVCTTTNYIETEWILNFFNPGQYDVQLFFVISGFVIPWAMYHSGYEFKNFFAFFLKRLARLEPPYLVSILLALTVLFARENLTDRTNTHIDISTQQVALHLGYLIPFFKEYHWLNSVYWTLAIEFQYYIFIALLFIPLIRAGSVSRILIYTSICVLSFFLAQNFLFFWLPVFLLGILLFLFKTKRIEKTEYYSVTTAVIILCFYKYPTASVLYAILPLIMILFFEDLKIKGLHFAGKFSYSIYLIHPILGASFINILSHHFRNPGEKFLVIIGGIVFTLTCSYITYLLIEKPSKKLSASIKYKKQN